MTDHRQRMLGGEPYLADDTELLADRRRCRLLSEPLNSTSAASPIARQGLPSELLGAVGEGAEISRRSSATTATRSPSGRGRSSTSGR